MSNKRPAPQDSSQGSSKRVHFEPCRIGPVSTQEEMDMKVLQFQNRKLAERLEQRQRQEADLRQRIEQLEKRQTSDEAVLCVVNRYWNQLNEDLRILLQRFDAETSDEYENRNENEATTSFLALLGQWDREELEEKLAQRVQVSTRAVAKVLQAFDRIVQRNHKIMLALKGDSEARLSGQDHDDDDLKEFEELLQIKKNKPEEQSFYDRAKIGVEKLVERVGFFGILACASIPNPLFDLAGITCGHFNVPFWTFFGATLIGKAIIKMHIQKLFVIVAFNERLVNELVNKMKYIPHIGRYLHAPLEEFLAKQKANLHRKPGNRGASDGPWIAWIFEKFVFLMILYYVLTIVNSLAQSHHKRLHKKQYRAMAKVATD